MTLPVSIIVIGAAGKMGQELVRTIVADPHATLAGVIDPKHKGVDAASVVGLPEATGVSFSDSLEAVLHQIEDRKQVVAVDLTRPSVVFQTAQLLVSSGVRPVIGTTGLSDEQLDSLNQSLTLAGLAGAYIPNFSIGAVLMMRFAKEASRYFSHAEIIEFHHNQKADAPSGTALLTARQMEAQRSGRTSFGAGNAPEKETLVGARGGVMEGGLHIHSVRLPGMVAHQEVLFGDTGQLLTLRHDSFHRSCFMPGILMACRGVLSKPAGLSVGLDSFMTDG